MSDTPVRLTRDPQGRIVKVEIYVDNNKRREILDTFPDKVLDWKVSAEHYLILKELAGYQKEQLTDLSSQESKTDKPKKLAELLKVLCHNTAPLYMMLNNTNFNNSRHPLYGKWLEYKNKKQKDGASENNLKVRFIRKQLKNYRKDINELFSHYHSHKGLKVYKEEHNKKIDAFILQLGELSRSTVSHDDIARICDHQSIFGCSESLGGFLRSQAHELMRYALMELDEVTEARFNQLFAFSAHPLRRKLVEAKSSLDKQESMHAARLLNTRSPIPAGQLDVLHLLANSEAQKGWMDIMPYINAQTSLGTIGIDSHEALNDIDQILCVAAKDSSVKLKKSRSLPYRMLMGEYGTWGIVGIVLFGLPAGLLVAASAVLTLSLAMAADILIFLILTPGLLALLAVGAVGAAIDFLIQIPSIFSQELETNFSVLTIMAEWPIPPQWLKDLFRKISCVRFVKQFLLDLYHGHQIIDIHEEPLPSPLTPLAEEVKFTIVEEHNGETSTPISKDELLNELRKNQSEGLVNAIGTKFFCITTIANFLHEKIRYLTFSMREFRKVIALTYEYVKYLFSNETIRFQEKQQIDIAKTLYTSVENRRKSIQQQINEALASKDITLSQTATSSANTAKLTYSYYRWASVEEWKSRDYKTPIDFASDISTGVIFYFIDPAFEQNPGIATPAFAMALLCSGALAFPSMDHLLPQNIVKALQVVPQYLAKKFMGKTLDPGISSIVTNIFSVFLQWQLCYFGAEGLIAICTGNIDRNIKKILENPEEITLGSLVFIAMGYAAGSIPHIPTDIDLFSRTYENPFFNALTDYANGVYKVFATFVDTIIDESQDVTRDASVAGGLELFVIGLKSAFLVYGLISGDHHEAIEKLDHLNIRKLCKAFESQKALFNEHTPSEEKLHILQNILESHGIDDKKIGQYLLDEYLPDELTLDVPKIPGKAKNLDEFTQRISPDPEKQQTLEGAKIKLNELLNLVLDLTNSRLPINAGYASENSKTQNISNVEYRSKADAEKIYDALYLAIEDYNNLAEQNHKPRIEAKNFLHAFYNKHCYSGSSGLHKLIFGLLLFPFTWAWRGIKYLIGTPSMRQQVVKSFCKDFAMVLQLFADIFAPFLRSLIRSLMYVVRMLMGAPILLPLITALAGILLVVSLAILTSPITFCFAIAKAIEKNDAQSFSQTIRDHLHELGHSLSNVWKAIMCNSTVNGFIEFVSHLGGPIAAGGTGSIHRLNLFKTVGLTSLYNYLANEADTNSDHLQSSLLDLINDLEEVEKVNVVKPSIKSAPLQVDDVPCYIKLFNQLSQPSKTPQSSADTSHVYSSQN